MSKPILGAAVLAMAVAVAGAAPASAQTVTSKTSDYTLSWSSPTFAGNSAFLAASLAYGAQPAFSGSNFSIGFPNGATGFALQDAGGITASAFTPLTTSPVGVAVSGDGSAGSWGYSYNAVSPYLATGTQGGLETLTFTGGGAVGIGGIYYYVNVFLPGNWTTSGTATGDYTFNGVGAGFSTPTFTYDPGTQVTTVSTFTTNYTNGENAGLDFTLFGASAAVPEPASWAVMILGLGMAGAAIRRRRAGPALAG